jgi:hypothetical protein
MLTPILRKFSKGRKKPKKSGVIALRRPNQSISWRVTVLF